MPKLSGQPPRKSESVKVRYPNPQRAILDVTLESTGLVILSDVDYPGWQLTIDDEPAPIYSRERLDARSARLRRPASPRVFVCTTIVSARAHRVDPRPVRLALARALLRFSTGSSAACRLS